MSLPCITFSVSIQKKKAWLRRPIVRAEKNVVSHLARGVASGVAREVASGVASDPAVPSGGPRERQGGRLASGERSV